MTVSSQKADSFISTVLGISGRVRAVDLGVIPEPDRVAALRDYFERHSAETPLYMTGDGELVAGSPPPEGASVAPHTQETPQDSRGGVDSIELDWLLGGYDAESSAEPGPEAGADNEVEGSFAAAVHAGASGDATPPSRGLPAAPKPSAARDESRVWLLWWVPTLLVPLLGGAAAWAVLRDKRLQAARTMFAVGLIAGMIASALFLRFAEPIAAFMTGAAGDTHITLPSSTAPPAPGGVDGSGSSSGASGM